MPEYLFDAALLVDYSLGRREAVDFVQSISESSVITHPPAESEVLVGANDRRELRRLEELLGRFHRVWVMPGDFDHCIAFLKRYALSHSVDWPDCLIAATALRLGLPVVTLNDKHFKVIKGLRIVRPY